MPYMKYVKYNYIHINDKREILLQDAEGLFSPLREDQEIIEILEDGIRKEYKVIIKEMRIITIMEE